MQQVSVFASSSEWRVRVGWHPMRLDTLLAQLKIFSEPLPPVIVSPDATLVSWLPRIWQWLVLSRSESTAGNKPSLKRGKGG